MKIEQIGLIGCLVGFSLDPTAIKKEILLPSGAAIYSDWEEMTEEDKIEFINAAKKGLEYLIGMFEEIQNKEK